MGDWIRELLETSKVGAAQAEAQRRADVARAMRLRSEIEAFERRWPATPEEEPMLPAISWRQLERQLADLADTPEKRAMAADMVSATRKLSAFKPPEMVLREILCLTWVLLDEEFQPDGDSAPTP